MMFPHHVIHGPNAPRPAPPTDPPEVPERVFKAAQAVNATHLSKDGKRVYCTRYGQPLEAKWREWEGWGAWEECEAIPGDAVVMG